MIKDVTLSAVFCDHCGKQYVDEYGTGFCAWTNEADAWEAANNDGWQSVHGRILCPDCYHFDDETNEVVENKFTKEEE